MKLACDSSLISHARVVTALSVASNESLVACSNSTRAILSCMSWRIPITDAFSRALRPRKPFAFKQRKSTKDYECACLFAVTHFSRS